MTPSMTDTVTLHVNSDPTTLGGDATPADVYHYAGNLAALLEREFNVSVHAVAHSGNTLVTRGGRQDDAMTRRVHEVERSDEWTTLLR